MFPGGGGRGRGFPPGGGGGRFGGGRFGGGHQIPLGNVMPHVPHVPVSLGPVHPIIFAGHLRAEEDTILRGDEAGDGDGEEGGQPSPANSRMHVFEINLNQQAYFLEGIHIVPLGFAPPVGFEFQGQTLPEASTGSTFLLEMYARDLDAAGRNVKKILSINVSGGIMWQEIPSPFNSIAVDYIAIKGTFEVLSLIIHGGMISSSDLRPDACKLLESGLPIPSGFVSGELEASDDAEYDSDEDGVDQDAVGVVGEPSGVHTAKPACGDRMAHYPTPPPAVLEALNFPVNFFNEKLKRRATDLTACLDLLSKHTSLPSKASAFCLVSIESMAGLIEAAFSVDLPELVGQTPQKQVERLGALAASLTSCLSSGSTASPLGAAASPRDEFAASLGEDVAALLASTAKRFLVVLGVDHSSALDEINAKITAPSEFLELGSAVLKYCSVLVLNEFTAKAMLSCGALQLLCSIISQRPVLPSQLQIAAINCLKRALEHPGVSADLSRPAYQALLNAMGNVESFSKHVSTPTRTALNWCAFVGCCLSLREFSNRATFILEKAAQAVTMHLAITSASGTATSADSMDVEGSGLGSGASGSSLTAASARMAACNEELRTLYSECKERVVAWQGSLCSLVDRRGEVDEDGDLRADSEVTPLNVALVKTLHANGIMATLVTIATLAHALDEHAILSDWTSPFARELGRLSRACSGLLVGCVGTLFGLVDGAELLVGSKPAEALLLWQMLAQDEHVFTAQSTEELTDALFSGPEAGDLEVCHLSFSSGSLGWLLLLFNYAMGITQRVSSLTEPETAIYDLHELASFPCGASVVARCVSQFCLDQVLGIIETTSPPPPEGLVCRCLEVLHCCLSSDCRPVVGQMVASAPRIVKCAKGILGHQKGHHHVSVRLASAATQALQLAEFLQKSIPANGGSSVKSPLVRQALLAACRKEIMSAASSSTSQPSSVVSLANIQALEVPMRLLVQAATEEDFLNATIFQNDEARKLLGGAVAVLRAATSYARGGVGWAPEIAIASIEGYDDSFFAEFQSPMPPLPATHTSATSEEAKQERVRVRLQLAQSLTRAMLSSLQLIRDLLHCLRVHAGVSASFRSEEVLLALMEANAFSRSLMGCHKTGVTGFLARRIASTVTQVFRQYCPPSPWAADCSLVAYLVGKALQVPRFMQANIALLTELLPVGSAAAQLEAGVDVESAAGTVTLGDSSTCTVSAQYFCRVSQSLAFCQEESGSSSFAEFVQHRRESAEGHCNAWNYFLSRSPAFTTAGKGRSEVTPFLVFTSERANHSTGYTQREPLSVDPLFHVSQALFNGRYDVLSLILCGLVSSSQEIHSGLFGLCTRVMALHCEAASVVAKGLVDALTNVALLHLHGSQQSMRSAAEVAAGAKDASSSGNPSAGSGNSANSKVDHEALSSQSRTLVFVHDLCCLDTPCLVLVDAGVLLPLFSSLHSSSSFIANLALQALTTVYRVLGRVTTRLEAAVASAAADGDMDLEQTQDQALLAILLHKVRATMQAVAEGLLALLPALIARFQSSALIAAQSVLSINALPPRFVKGLLDSMAAPGSIIPIEAISVKLWLFFEDTFQSFITLVEALKSVTAVDACEFFSVDNGVEIVTAAHSQLAASSSALATVIEIVIDGYAKGWIALPTMNRSLRSAVADPRRVVSRYQRTYTMWSTERRRAYVHEGLAAAAADEAQEFPLPPVHRASQLERLDFDARHAMIASSLRSLVESTRRHHEHTKSQGGNPQRDEAVRAAGTDPSLAQAGVIQLHAGLDLAQPLATDDDTDTAAVNAWFVLLSPDERLGDCLTPLHLAQDALHAVVRRSYVMGSEAVCSIFEVVEPFIRLRSLPRIADPQADRRRRDRRIKRRVERAAAKKAAAEVAAETARILALEAEAKRRQQEEEARQREAETAASAQAAAPQLSLPGVPKHLLAQLASAQGLPAPAPAPVPAPAPAMMPVPVMQAPVPAPAPPTKPSRFSSALSVGQAPPPPPYSQPPGYFASALPPPPMPPSMMPQGAYQLPPPPLPPPSATGAPAGRGRAATLPAWLTNQQPQN